MDAVSENAFEIVVSLRRRPRQLNNSRRSIDGSNGRSFGNFDSTFPPESLETGSRSRRGASARVSFRERSRDVHDLTASILTYSPKSHVSDPLIVFRFHRHETSFGNVSRIARYSRKFNERTSALVFQLCCAFSDDESWRINLEMCMHTHRERERERERRV